MCSGTKMSHPVELPLAMCENPGLSLQPPHGNIRLGQASWHCGVSPSLLCFFSSSFFFCPNYLIYFIVTTIIAGARCQHCESTIPDGHFFLFIFLSNFLLLI